MDAVSASSATLLTALAPQRPLAPAGVEVAVVELPMGLGNANVHSTMPAIEALHARRIGIGETALLRSVGGVFSHGCNVGEPDGNAFFLGFGTHGSPVHGAALFPVRTMARRHGLDARLQDFSPVTAATNDRLLLANDETAAYGRADYGYRCPWSTRGRRILVAISASPTRSPRPASPNSDRGMRC